MKCRPNIKHYQSCAISTITRSNWQNKQLFVAHVVKVLAMEMKLPRSQTGNWPCSSETDFTHHQTLVGGEEQQFKKNNKKNTTWSNDGRRFSNFHQNSWIKQTFFQKSCQIQHLLTSSGGGVRPRGTWLARGKGRVCGGRRLSNRGGQVRRWWRKRGSTWRKTWREHHSWGWTGPHWGGRQSVRVTHLHTFVGNRV